MRTLHHYLPLGVLLLLSEQATAPPDSTSAPAASAALAFRAPPSSAAPQVVVHVPGPTELAADALGHQPYRADQIMVAPRAGEDLEAIAARWGAPVLRAVGHSGYGALGVPDGMTAEALRDALQTVAHTAPMGATRGAARPDSTTPAACTTPVDMQPALQWHHQEIGTVAGDGTELAKYTVAVLDTGAAYEDYGVYVAAPSLAGVAIVAPYDFVNGDLHPNDDHQHGTHIASLIVGDSADVQGVAAGAALMPLKVLDQNNAGTELDLIEAIHWAVASGADVINMSLSFSEHYAPSVALQEALQAARDAGVVMVAASGNDGAKYVSWPAASPHVIAVAASRRSSTEGGTLEGADYSNRGAAIDILAPGGDLTQDTNRDGLPDGIIGESFARNAPDQIGLWMFAGTSQAAALTSGAALWSLAAGSDPGAVAVNIQDGARANETLTLGGFFSSGYGAGLLKVNTALTLACSSKPTYDADRFVVAALPWLARVTDTTVAPRVRLAVLERSTGAAASGAEVYVNLSGESGGVYSCKTDLDGACTITPAAVPETDELAWLFRVDTVVDKQISYHPSGVLFGSDALEIVLQAIEDEALEDALLAWAWPESTDADLGDVAESIVAVNSGTGLVSSPVGTIFSYSSLSSSSTLSTSSSFSLDGTGLVSSPIGTLSYQKLSLSSSSDLLSGSSMDVVLLDASGSDNEDLGLSAPAVLGNLGDPLDEPALHQDDTLIALDAPSTRSGSATAAWADRGGFRLDGYPVADALIGTDLLSAPAEATSMLSEGHGSRSLSDTDLSLLRGGSSSADGSMAAMSMSTWDTTMGSSTGDTSMSSTSSTSDTSRTSASTTTTTSTSSGSAKGGGKK